MRKMWDQFWFASQNLYNISLFRMLLGIILFVMYLIRFQDFAYYYFAHGALPLAYVTEAFPPGYAPSHPLFFASDSGIYFQGIIHLTLLASLALGLLNRPLTFILFLLNAGLLQRNMSIIYGADLFANFWLFYLSFIDHSRIFSILNFFKKKRNLSLNGDMLSTVGIRLLQIQLCLSYAYTGVEKLKGSQWWEGSAVWEVIGMKELFPRDLAFMQHYPKIIAIMSMVTIIFEIYFIFAVWSKKLRLPWLIVGFMFHLGTAVFMNLWFFFLVMTSSYLVFLPNLENFKFKNLSLKNIIRYLREAKAWAFEL